MAIASRSAIKQIASGRFGVTSRYLMSADEIQIKMAQGAKPGEGGHLPGGKVWPWIARARRCTPGVGLISPPPHHDIYSIEDLAEVIFDMKNANPRARISVKLVAEAGVGTIATGVAKGGAHKILVSGSNGGTGAAPRDSIYHAGLPLELGLAETQQTLLRNGLRSRVVLEADGKLMDGRDVAIACLLGAEEFGFATMPLVAMGCLMQRDCQQDTCPVGIATQNCLLRKRFCGQAGIRRELHDDGGRAAAPHHGRFRLRDRRGHGRSRRVPPSAYDVAQLEGAPGRPFARCSCSVQVEYGRSIPGAIARIRLLRVPPRTRCPRRSTPPCSFPTRMMRARAFAAALPCGYREREPLRGDDARLRGDGAACRGASRWHADGRLHGFGRRELRGVSARRRHAQHRGRGERFLRQGLSGGIVTVAPPRTATYRPEENIVAGNVAFYGATGGRGFVNGLAGQRFAVRNSGATLVVEGVGNNGCEYMTGGTVLVLGEVGLNFAAGMSGGVAYVYDAEHTLAERCNRDMVDLKEPDRDELAQFAR